jgi:UDP:flavonoid glycosyltransferase YjiC (YdhE family)
MRIAVISLDTRGGIQPYIALSLGLKRAGHDVRMVAPADFKAMIGNQGLPVFTTTGNIEETMRTLTSGVAEKGRLATMRYARDQTVLSICGWTREILAGCEGVELVTGGVGGLVGGGSVAEKLGVPFLQTHLQPIGAATSAFPGVLVPGLPRWLWRLSHSLSELGIWGPFRGAMAKARKEVLGLPAREAPVRDDLPVLYGFSPHVIPHPPEWGPERQITGYWTLPAGPDWAPPPALASFLAAGPPPVCIGFGSMTSEDPAAMSTLVLEAVRRAGVRAVLLSGWGGLGEVAREDVFVTSEAPHDWLYPGMAAVVHHGGAGTTGAALRAGVPAIVVPFTMDQPFWGSRVHALGVGPRPIPRKKLSVEALSEALRSTVADQAMKARAAALGEKLRAEDGVANAVAAFARVKW